MFPNFVLIVSIVELLLCISFMSVAQLEEWKIPCGAPYKPKGCENSSLEAFLDIEDFERCAPAKLNTTFRQYVWGASGKQKTFFENKAAYKRMWIRGKRLRGFSKLPSLETSVFGRKISTPIGISPTISHDLYHPDGEKGVARGAASAGAVMIMGAFSVTSLEAVAASVPKDTELWMQTLLFRDRRTTMDIVRRAEAAGFKAIVVTVDEIYFYEIRCNARQNFYNHYAQFKNPNIKNYNTNSTDDLTDEDLTITFKDITWLSTVTKLPIVVKGILTAEDAISSLEAGASAILVSNQGGRELDDGVPTIDALPAIVQAVRTQFPEAEIFVDGGIRSGHDVFKALARGATMAFIGRPAIWGLTVGGEKGVEKVVDILKKEFQNALLHAGFSRPSEITSSSIISQWIYTDYH